MKGFFKILKEFLKSGYYRGLPQKRMGAGVLFFNENGELLIIKNTYKDYWSIPGGVVDKDESPREAAIREVKEEVNLDTPDLRLLCIDYYRNPLSPKGESLQFLFYGGILKEKQIKAIKLQDGEVEKYKFASLEEAWPILGLKLRKRIKSTLKAIDDKSVLYLENGEEII